MYERLPSPSLVPVRCVCRRRCLLYFAAFSCSSILQRKCMYPMGAGIPTSFGTRAASAELNLPSFPILSAHCCLSAILPHSDWASLEQRHISGACRQCARLPTQLTAGDTQSRLVFTSYKPLSLHPRFTAAHCPARPAVCIARSCTYSRVILLFMAALSRCMSSPQVTLPHAAHGTDSSCRGRQPYSQCSACCQSADRLCLRLLSGLLTARHRFFSTAARDTHSRLICHPPFT
jgi:hypothetical protein